MVDTIQKSGSFSRKKNISLQVLKGDTALLIGVALLTFLAHMLTGANYGFFRDELYYIDAGKHLSFGYVEFSAFIALLAALVHHTFGNSLLAYHVLPALAGSCLIVLTGLITRELGGGRFAQGLAAFASLVALNFLAMDAIFSMDSFDELWWVLCAYILIRLIKYKKPRYWLLFALVAGLGLLTKMTILMFGFAVIAGLLLTRERKWLASRWVWSGAVLAFAFLVPYILWNAAHGWPTLEFWSGYTANHSSPTDASGFLFQQILTMNPLTFPLWLTGLCAYFGTRELKPYRVFGWAFIILYVLFMLSHAKVYFLAPAYPPLFAAGALLFEHFLQHSWRRWLKPLYLGLLFLTGVALAPIAMPILPPAIYGQTMAFVGGNAGVKVENRETSVLPQQLADRFGWDTMTATVAGVYHSLPQREQTKACILTSNYGEAGAIDLYGPNYQLPQAISGHNTYYLWGPGNCTGQVVLTVGYTQKELQPFFGSVTQSAIITCSYCMPAEDNLPIYVARDLKSSIHTLWPQVKHYN